MPTTIKVMTWNVENLFRPPVGAASADAERFQRKLALLAETIVGLEPDVVALQELGGDEPLRDLQEALAAGYPHRRFSGFPDRRGIGVAFLSRLPLEDHEDIIQLPSGPALEVSDLDETGNPVPIDRMGRGALRIRVAKEGFTADLVTAHVKSKLLSFPRPGGRTSFVPRDEGERAQVAGIALRRRTAEAVALRLRANELLGAGGRVPLLVLGDLNDVPDAATTQILLGPSGSELVPPASIEPMRATGCACSTSRRRSPRRAASRASTGDAASCSTRSWPRGSFSRAGPTGGDNRRSRWTAMSSSRAACRR